MNIAHLCEQRYKLNQAIDELEAYGSDSPALDGLYDLLNEVCDQIDIWDSEGPKRAAQERLAFHIENDTLDLY